MDNRRYDASQPPPPEDWLAMDEGDRLAAVAEEHRRTRAQVGQSPEAHAAIHVVIENQLAEGYPPALRAYERGRAAGLGRHATVHALASVVTTHMLAALQGTAIDLEILERDYDALDPASFKPKK